jgi:hypothetical protein
MMLCIQQMMMGFIELDSVACVFVRGRAMRQADTFLWGVTPLEPLREKVFHSKPGSTVFSFGIWEMPVLDCGLCNFFTSRSCLLVRQRAMGCNPTEVFQEVR